METKDTKKKVPELSFPLFKEECELSSSRSEFDDIFLPLSRRDQTNGMHQENIEDQVDRLNQILENVMLEISKTNDSSLNVSKINDSIYTSDNSKIFCGNTSYFLPVIEETDELLSYIHRLQMNIQDLESRIFQRNYSSDSCEFRKEIAKELERYIVYSREGLNNPSLTVSLEKALNCIKSTNDISLSTTSFLSTHHESNNPAAMLKDEFFINRSTLEQIPTQSLNEDLQDSLQFTLDLYNKSISLLCQQLSNLTSIELLFTGNTPEIELPELVSNIPKIISEIISRETDLELREKAFPKFSFADKMQVACTYEEMIGIQERICGIMQELSEFGSDKEYCIKVGLISIGISVYFSDDCKAKYYSLPGYSLCQVHQPSFEERAQSLVRGRIPNAHAITERLQKAVAIDSKVYIEELQDEVIELNRKIMNLEEINEMEDEMKAGIEIAAKERIYELEDIVDKQMFEIELQKRQIDILKNGGWSNENQQIRDCKEKICDLNEKERFLKGESERIEVEKQKIIKEAIYLQCKKENLFEQSKDFEGRRENELKFDKEVEVYPSLQENFSQTSPKNSEQAKGKRENELKFNKEVEVYPSLKENFSQTSPKNSEQAEGKRENELKFNKNVEVYPSLKENFSQTSPKNSEQAKFLCISSVHSNDYYSESVDSNPEKNSEVSGDNMKIIKKKLNEIQTKKALMSTEKSIDYAYKKLNLIEKKINRDSISQSILRPKENHSIDILSGKKDISEKHLAELQHLYSNIENFDINHERAKILRDRMHLQKQQQKFDKKRDALKQKIVQVNDRAAKLSDLEKRAPKKAAEGSLFC